MKPLLPLTFGICVATFAANFAHANESASLVLDFVPSAVHAPYYYARSQGWYKNDGIDLTIEVGRGSVYSSQTVSTGRVHFGVADLATAFVAIGKGADIRAIMNIYGNSPQGFYWLKSSGIRGPR